jgi:hypothetical protein
MNSTAGIQTVVSSEERGNNEQFKAQFSEYLKRQPGIVRGLHYVLQVLALFCFVLAGIFFFTGLYHTYIWVTTGSFTSLGEATYLPEAWVNYGLSMSFLVFPLGLDAMLLRVFPAVIFPAAWYRSSKPITYRTGIGAFFAGFGIMCAGAPGAVRMIELALQAIR